MTKSLKNYARSNVVQDFVTDEVEKDQLSQRSGLIRKKLYDHEILNYY